MKEYGSDFHYITDYQGNGVHLYDLFPSAIFLADGRMCLQIVIERCKWKRLWVPQYFCFDVINTIRRQTEIDVKFYKDYPGADDNSEISKIRFQEGDALLRMNYFGMRAYRSALNVPVPVIEDHSHDLLGNWICNSDADWCFASLRKTLPIAEGGMLWSPKGHKIRSQLQNTEANEQTAERRWRAMELKADYLRGKDVNKDAFRKLYMNTEKWFDTALPSLMDNRTKEFIQGFDIYVWYDTKRNNINKISSLLNNQIKAEDSSCNLFSFIIRSENRDKIKKNLINKQVYPSILWDVAADLHSKAKIFNQSMLSIHCDGRYSESDIEELSTRIKESI